MATRRDDTGEALDYAARALATRLPLDREAAGRADRLVRSLDLAALLRLDHEVRERSPWGDEIRQAWAALRPADLSPPGGFGPASASLLGLASFHANGHVRQAAVDRLAPLRDGLALAFLIIRLNDWVPNVRAAARAAVLARIEEARAGDDERAREIVAHLSLLDRLAAWGRDDHGAVRSALAALFASPSFARALDEGLGARDPALRYRSYRLALALPAASPAALLLRALRDGHAPLRRWAAREALARLGGEDLRAAAALMLEDRLPGIRNEGLFAVATRLSPLDPEPLRRALLDPSASVRWTARHYLAQRAPFDARAHYQRALAEAPPDRLAAALAGLGESGEPADTPLVTPYLTYRAPAVRRAALLALGRLAPDASLPALVEALRGRSSVAAREAGRVVAARAHLLDRDTLADVIRAAPTRIARRIAVEIAGGLDHWTAIELLLGAAADPDAEVARDASTALARRLRSHYRAPPPPAEVVQRLGRNLEAARPALGEYLAARIGHELGLGVTRT